MRDKPGSWWSERFSKLIKKRQRTAALQDASAPARIAILPPGFGVRLSSAAFFSQTERFGENSLTHTFKTQTQPDHRAGVSPSAVPPASIAYSPPLDCT